MCECQSLFFLVQESFVGINFSRIRDLVKINISILYLFFNKLLQFLVFFFFFVINFEDYNYYFLKSHQFLNNAEKSQMSFK